MHICSWFLVDSFLTEIRLKVTGRSRLAHASPTMATMAMPSPVSSCARAKAMLQAGTVTPNQVASAASATASLFDSRGNVCHRPPIVVLYHYCLGSSRLELAIMVERIIRVYFDSFTRARHIFICMKKLESSCLPDQYCESSMQNFVILLYE